MKIHRLPLPLPDHAVHGWCLYLSDRWDGECPQEQDASSPKSTLAGLPAVAQTPFMPAHKSIVPRRRCASAEAALRAEMARIEAMTLEERVKAALSLPERFSWLAPVNPTQSPTHHARRRKQPAGR